MINMIKEANDNHDILLLIWGEAFVIKYSCNERENEGKKNSINIIVILGWCIKVVVLCLGPSVASGADTSGECEGVCAFPGLPRHFPLLREHLGETQTGRFKRLHLSPTTLWI